MSTQLSPRLKPYLTWSTYPSAERIEYKFRYDGTLAGDDRAGGVRHPFTRNGAAFASYLYWSSAWRALTLTEKDAIRKTLPITPHPQRRGAVRGRSLRQRPHVRGRRQRRFPKDVRPGMTSPTDLFEEDLDLPDPDADRRYHQLIGLDVTKARLAKEAELILQPAIIERWSVRHHGTVLAAVRWMADRAPLFVFEGDVGSGKTTLAETFASNIARRHGVSVKVHRLSLRARGTGAVGEMTRLLGAAFDFVLAEARKHRTNRPTVLVVDEADAIAQSREAAQMHHEDRAGVNALIRGIDALTNERKLGVIVVLCTNRSGAIDPAVRRRAAASFRFGRPDERQREAMLTELFADASFHPAEIDELVAATGPTAERRYGYAYSDIVNRLMPAAILAAYPDEPLSAAIVLDQVDRHPPTKPFDEQP